MEEFKKEIALMQKQIDLNEKSNSLEFQNISTAFQRFGELTELVYLELTTLLDLLDKKEIINQEDFGKQLELTGDSIQAEAVKNANKDKDEIPDAEKQE